MLAFGVNFNLYYMILVRQVKKALRDEELRWYLLTVLAAVVLICINIYKRYDSASQLICDAFFTVSSVITTTGYATADFGSWPVLSQTVLLLLMFFGACAGSTGGGLKISRVGILVKSAIAELRKSKDPNMVVRTQFNSRPLAETEIHAIIRYFVVYVAVFILLLLLVCLDETDFLTAFSAVAGTYNNIGPGLGMAGPMYSFAAFSPFSKIVLSFGMITGRLELFPVLVLFLPSTWRKRG